MATRSVYITSFVLGIVMCMLVETQGNWSWELKRENNISPMNRHIRSRIPHVGVRRSIFDKFWSDTTPNNPLLTHRPPAPRMHPRLKENEFIITGDDYDDDVQDSHWLPQMQRHHTRQHPKSLEGLEHILEEKLIPIHNPAAREHHKGIASELPKHKDDIEKKQKSKHWKHQKHISSHKMSPSPEDEVGPPSRFHSLEPERLHHLPAFIQETPLLNNDPFRKDILNDFQHQFGMPDHFTNQKQFPKDFLSPEQFPNEFGLEESLPKGHLSTGPFAIEVDEKQPFQDHLFLSSLSDHEFGRPDRILDLDTAHSLSDADLPQIFPDLGILGNIGKQESFIPQGHLGHFGLPSSNNNPSIISEDGKGLEWLRPGIPGLNLPSHNHMISALEEQTMSKEAQRDDCHARNLHTCGSRLIDEIAFGPNNPDKCRIREEFLDCMEQVMKLPCELHGEHYSREGTKLIRDKIKTLLWSAQGCILGYSS